MVVFTRGEINGRMVRIAVSVITEEMKQHVVYGITLKVAAPGVITRCLVMYQSGVWICMTEMPI
jgi:hypothetical protein